MTESQNHEGCAARNELPCQFQELSGNLIECGDRRYCLLHCPTDNMTPELVESVRAHLVRYINSRWIDFTKVQFPVGAYGFPKADSAYQFREAVFKPDVRFDLPSSKYTQNFSRCIFEGKVTLTFQGLCIVSFDGSEFLGNIKVRSKGGGPEARGWSFEGATIHGELNLEGINFGSSLSFNRCSFRKPVRFDGVQFPQQTGFYEAKFGPMAVKASAEGSYRAARKAFHELKARDLEGMFYSLEKRCQRAALRRASLAYWINSIYRSLSDYGQSFERVFWQFLGIQAFFGLIYAIWSRRISFGPIDWDVVAFTLSQIVKPFELLSGKRPDSATYQALVSQAESTATLAVVTFAHSVISLSLVALFLLALRWRFKRD